MDRPLYLIFAGVNGAGKSTFFRSKLWRTRDMPRTLTRVNADEMLVAAGGDAESATDQLAAGREAVRKIDSLIARRRSFNQETTLSGRLALKHIQRARRAGYRIVMYYIGLASPELADERIEHRALTGGHYVDPVAVARRYRASIRTMSSAIDLCDEVIALDNTEAFNCIAQWSDGVLCWVGDLKRHGAWLMNAIADEKIWRLESEQR